MDTFKIFSELVFPVAVTTYLLVITTNKIDKLSEEFRSLREEIHILRAEKNRKEHQGDS